MSHGCYGIRLTGIDKLAYAGPDASPPHLGMKIIREITETIQRIGYPESIKLWKCQASRLVMRHADNPLMPASLNRILSDGMAAERKGFILDGYACGWAYIANLDTEMFEVYEGGQIIPHSQGRYARPFTICNRILGQRPDGNDVTVAMATSYYPCALLFEIPLESLPTFDPRAYLIA